jgi:hypothetical protein
MRSFSVRVKSSTAASGGASACSMGGASNNSVVIPAAFPGNARRRAAPLKPAMA